MKRKLSQRQQQILDFTREFISEHHFPPTVRDIQAGCGISSTSVVDYNLQILHREGYLRRLPEVSRGIEILEEASERPRRNIVRVPLLGNIAAGDPLHIPSQDSWHSDAMENIDLPPSFLRGKSNVFALRVKGDSMIDALVADGDLVLLESVPQVENGDMVAAWLTDREEATLKRFHLQGETVRLQPANSTMEPIEVRAEDVAVRGRVVGVIRHL